VSLSICLGEDNGSIRCCLWTQGTRLGATAYWQPGA